MTTTDALYTVKVTINGQPYEVQVPARRTLVDMLRYDLDMTGTKETCSVGVCGACTVLINDEIAASCITLAVQACGPERIYPPEHRGLASRIREAGLVLTEMPPGTPPSCSRCWPPNRN